jgi:hypothetical protein
MTGFTEDPTQRYPKSGLNAWHGRHLARHGTSPLGDLAGLAPYCGLGFVPSDEWDRSDPFGAAAFIVGIWFSHTPEWLQEAMKDQAWRDTLPADLFIRAEKNDCSGRKIYYLGQLATVGASDANKAKPSADGHKRPSIRSRRHSPR